MKKHLAQFCIVVFMLMPFFSDAEPIERPAAWKIRFDRLNTEDGLNRYDGYAFKIYRSKSGEPNDLSHDGVFSIFKDRADHIWIGTDRFDPTTETFTHYRNDPANPNSLSENLLCMLKTRQPLFQYHQNRRRKRPPAFLPRCWINSAQPTKSTIFR